MCQTKCTSFEVNFEVFKMVYRLRMNFAESWLGVDRNKMMRSTSIINCKVMVLPTTYLGMSLQGNPNR